MRRKLRDDHLIFILLGFSMLNTILSQLEWTWLFWISLGLSSLILFVGYVNAIEDRINRHLEWRRENVLKCTGCGITIRKQDCDHRFRFGHKWSKTEFLCPKCGELCISPNNQTETQNER